MGKRGRSQKKDNRNPKRRTRDKDVLPEDMDDEIDACNSFWPIVYFCVLIDLFVPFIYQMFINSWMKITDLEDQVGYADISWLIAVSFDRSCG